MAEREAAGRVVERLGVGEPSVESFEGRRRWTSAAVVSTRADLVAPRIVAERPDVAVRAERAVVRQPRGAPAEAGDAEPLEPLGERPQLVEPERLGGPGDEVLAHRRAMRTRASGRAADRRAS